MTEEEVQALQNELETTKTELERTTNELESFRGSFAAKEATISQLEQAAAEKDTELTTLKASVAESEEKFTSLNGSLETTINAYREVLLTANQNIPQELITGTTIDELNASVEKAATLVSQVRESIEAEIAAGRVPAGAPPRTPQDLSALSAREKIEYAVSKSR